MAAVSADTKINHENLTMMTWPQIGNVNQLLQVKSSNVGGPEHKLIYTNPDPKADVNSIVITKSPQLYPDVYFVSVNLSKAFEKNRGQTPIDFFHKNKAIFESYCIGIKENVSAELSLNLSTSSSRLKTFLSQLGVPQSIINSLLQIQMTDPFLKQFNDFHQTLLKACSEAGDKSIKERNDTVLQLLENAEKIMNGLGKDYIGVTKFDQHSDLYLSILEYCIQFDLMTAAYQVSFKLPINSGYAHLVDNMFKAATDKKPVILSGGPAAGAGTGTGSGVGVGNSVIKSIHI